MPTAWQVRDYQRQKLLEILQRRTMDFEEDQETGPNFYYELAFAVIKYLRNQLNGAIAPDWKIPGETVSWFISSQVLPLVMQSSRTKEEADFMIGKYLGWVVEQILHPLNSEMMRQQVHEPVKVYGAKTMDEVPMPVDEEDD